MKKMVIIRGPSGSGKSTIARAVQRDEYNSIIHEADDFWYTPTLIWSNSEKVYNFKMDKLGKAHSWCKLNVEHSLLHNVPLVIVSNTSMSLKETRPYQNLAKEYGYEVDIIRTPRPWDVNNLDARNIHGVPFDVLENQVARYEPVIGEVEWDDMTIFKETCQN